MFRILKNVEAIRLDDFLIIADLHLGFEVELRKDGYYIPSQTWKMFEKILKCKGRAKKLIINGDLKHSIPFPSFKERKEIPEFLRKLAKEFEEIIILRGNHDSLIQELIPKTLRKKVKLKKSFLYSEFGIFHGHAWPRKTVFRRAKVGIIGHIHPVHEIVDGVFKKCWILANLERDELSRKLKTDVKMEKLLIMPCFNDYFFGSKCLISPLSKYISSSEILLLDLSKVT